MAFKPPKFEEKVNEMKTFRDVLKECVAGDEIRCVAVTAARWESNWTVGKTYKVNDGFPVVFDDRGMRPGRFWSNPAVMFEKVVTSTFKPLKDLPLPEVAALVKAHNDGQAIKFRDGHMARHGDNDWLLTSDPDWDGDLEYALAKTPEQIREDELVAKLEKLDAETVKVLDTIRDLNEGRRWDTKWGEMTRKVQGEFLLKSHEGASFQFRNDGHDWITLLDGVKPEFEDSSYYRQTPARVIELQNRKHELNDERNEVQNELNSLRGLATPTSAAVVEDDDCFVW